MQIYCSTLSLKPANILSDQCSLRHEIFRAIPKLQVVFGINMIISELLSCLARWTHHYGRISPSSKTWQNDIILPLIYFPWRGFCQTWFLVLCNADDVSRRFSLSSYPFFTSLNWYASPCNKYGKNPLGSSWGLRLGETCQNNRVWYWSFIPQPWVLVVILQFIKRWCTLYNE